MNGSAEPNKGVIACRRLIAATTASTAHTYGRSRPSREVGGVGGSSLEPVGLIIGPMNAGASGEAELLAAWEAWPAVGPAFHNTYSGGCEQKQGGRTLEYRGAQVLTRYRIRLSLQLWPRRRDNLIRLAVEKGSPRPDRRRHRPSAWRPAGGTSSWSGGSPSRPPA